MASRKKSPVINQTNVVVPPEDMATHDMNTLVANLLASRQEFFQKFFDPRRNILKECGYPETGAITAQNLRELYDREAVATRVVQLMPKECWQSPPTMVEDADPTTTTAFEKAWDELPQNLDGEQSWFKDTEMSSIWEYLRIADELSGIGFFGILLLMVDDNKPWDQPLDGVQLATAKYPTTAADVTGTEAQYMGPSGGEDKPAGPRPTQQRRLLGLRSFDDTMVQIVQYEANLRNPRFGHPIRYLVTMNDPRQQYTGVGLSVAQVYVHWTRVIHIADNTGSGSRIFGVPRMRPVLNRLLDLQKLYGGSAEMYWKGAFPGLSIESNPQLGSDVTMNMPQIREDMTAYMNGLQRYLTLQGLTAKTLAPQVVDPTPQINTQIEGICIQLGCPKRVFMGSERGELASSQDDASWNDRITGRNRTHTTPRIIVPFTDRCIQANILPEPKSYKALWPDLNAMTDQDKATIGLTRTQALVAYVGGNGESLIQPMDYLTKVLDFSDDDAQTMIESTQSTLDTEDESGRMTPDPAAPSKLPVDSEGNNVYPLPQDEEDDDEDTADLENTGTEPTGNELDEDWGLVQQPTNPVTNYSPTERRDKQGRWTSGYSTQSTAGADAKIAALIHVKNLGGSTGATLVKDTAGNHFVLKKGSSPEHLRAEFAAEQAYRALGVHVPTSRLYETSSGPVKLSRFKEGTELGQHSAGEIKHMLPELQKHFAAHVVLANWDVVGASKDNILVGKGKLGAQKLYHIDTGGALDYRAQGGLKNQNWNGKADEFHTLRSPTNAQAHSIFGGMTNKQLKDSVADVLSKQDKLLNALPEKYHEVIKQRLISLKNHADNLPDSSVQESHSIPVTVPHKTHLESVEGLSSHLASTGAVSKGILKKIQDLNPNGIENGVLKVSLDAVSSKIAPHLPAGTIIQKTSHKALFGKSKEVETKKLTNEQIESAMQAYEAGHQAKYGTPLLPETEKSVLAHIAKHGYAPIVGELIPTKAQIDKSVKETHPKSYNDIFGNPVKPGTEMPMMKAGANQSHVTLTPKEIDAEVPKAVQLWKNGLSEHERGSISDWKGSSTEIRKAISKNPPPPPTDNPQAAAFFNAIEKAPMVKGVVYRGLKDKSYADVKYATQQIELIKSTGVGGTWTDHAPMCMSPNTSTAHSFAGGQLMLKIHTKTGRSIKYEGGHTGESEVTAMPGVTHRIIAIHENHKVGSKIVKHFVELEEI